MKDPAFLFYTNDFDSGTKFLNNEQLGVYVRLLMAQHQHGRLTDKQVNFICPLADPDVLSKFKKDELGLWYNDRLEIEINKRKAFADSRRSNVKKRYPAAETTSVHTYVATSVGTSVTPSVPTSVVHMENENRNENENRINGFMADSKHCSIPLSTVQIGACIQYLQITKQKNVTPAFVEQLWTVFKIKEFTGKKWYNDEGSIFTHFLNSLKYEKIDDFKTAPAVRHNDSKANSILSLTD